MTESSTTLTWFPLSQRIGTPGSAGQLLPGVIARVVREDGSDADVNEPGELWLRGAFLCFFPARSIFTLAQVATSPWGTGKTKKRHRRRSYLAVGSELEIGSE